jgi:hypothetical protein
MLREFDHILVADNRSVDGTGEILRSFDRVTVLTDPDLDFHVDHQQARRTTALASLAAQRGADWVVPFDADEVWVTRDGRRVGDMLDGLPAKVLVARAHVVNHVITDRDPPGADAPARMVYRRPEFHAAAKVACRTAPGLWIVKGNHRATYHDIAVPLWVDGLLRVHHFPVRSAEQFARKMRYRADGLWRSSLPPDAIFNFLNPGKVTSLRVLKEEGEDALVARFHEEHWFADPDAAGLVRDPCP